MDGKIKVEKGNIQETLLLPLWGRAFETQKDKPRLIDNKAVEIIKKLDYDFSAIEDTQSMSQHGWVARCLHIDKKVRDFIKKHPEGSIVNIGCGLDTTFNRVDNGKITFYELDLPDVIELRKQLIKDSERHISIASSFLETRWFEQVKSSDGLLFISGGVFCYFNEEQIKRFFISTADYFGCCEIYFDALSPFGMKIANRKVLESGGMGGFSGGWGLKDVESIEKWDNRIKVIDSKPMHKGMKKGLSFKTKLILSIPDLLGVCLMVHLRIES